MSRRGASNPCIPGEYPRLRKLVGVIACVLSSGAGAQQLKFESFLAHRTDAPDLPAARPPLPFALGLERRLKSPGPDAPVGAATLPLQSLIVTVRVNEQDKGEHIVQLRAPDEFLVRKDALEQWAHLPEGIQPVEIEGDSYVSLSRLSHARVEFDDSRLELKITFPPEAFANQVFAFQQARRVLPPVSSDPSALLNYHFGYGGSSRDSSSQVSAATEASVHYRDWLFRSQGFYTRSSESASAVRGLTTLSRDDPINLTRLSLGDTATGVTDLTGGVILGGIGYSRAFELDPYLVRQPTASFRATVDLPSQVDVYVGNNRIYRQNVGPGPFELGNLSFLNGRRDLRVVLRDVFGREREVSFPFYFADRGLGAGLQDFSYVLGKVRENIATQNADYGRMAFSASHRVGVNDVLTLGAQAEGTGDFINGGPSLVLRSDRLGIVSLALLASVERAEHRGGAAGVVSYSYQSGAFAAFLAARKAQPGFTSLRTRDAVGLPLLDNTASLSYSAEGYGTLALSHHHLHSIDDSVAKITSLTYSIPFGRQWTLQASYRRTTGFAAGYEWFAGLQYLPSPALTTFTAIKSDGRNRTASVQAGNLLPEGEGLGYRVSAEVASGPDGATRTLAPEITYQAKYATIRANVTNLSAAAGNTSLYAISVGGALAYVGGTFGLSRPIDDSFALARIEPPMAGVRVYLNQQETGRTGPDGTLLLPRVISYVQNNIGIDDRDVPIENSLEEKSRMLVPYSHSGSVVISARRAMPMP